MQEVMYKECFGMVQQFSAEMGEPEWMLKVRKTALKQVDDLDWPVFERVNYKRWPLLEIPDLTTFEGFILPEDQEYAQTPQIVQVGHQTMVEFLPKKYRDQGVIFTDIFTALREYPDLVEECYMNRAVKPNEDKLTAFHAAFMTSGVFLYVPKHVVIEEPLEATFVQNSLHKNSWIKHVLVYADSYSSFTYVEKYETVGTEKGSANIIVEVIAKPGATVKVSAVDQLGEHTTSYLNRRGHTDKDASIDWAVGVMNTGNVIADFDTDLVGEGSSSEVKVVTISMGNQIQGIDTRVTNFGRHTTGHILQHGVILDKSTLTFNGIGHILKGAKGADAQQESRILMLSEHARGDANPILLIDENDVTAGHAASVGRVDPEELYYLMSRGIPRQEAERLVIRGFLGAVITAIPLKSVRTELVETIERKLSE